jgi:hypothetical protein
MKKIIAIGKPTHYRPKNDNVSACGVIAPDYAAYDPRDCNCVSCRKTKVYKIAMGQKE